MTMSIDPSTRYVLGDSARLLANLAALWATDPRLAAAIEGCESLPSYALSPSKLGGETEPTLSMNTPTGRQLQLHSRHRPSNEAKALVDSINVIERAVFCIH